MTSSGKPVPVPDDLSEGFWAAAAEHVLAVQRCARCGWLAYPPRIICVSCLSDIPAFMWEPVSGRGHVKTWTIMRDVFLAGFDDDVPYVVADVELVEQPDLRIIASLKDIDVDDLQLGLPVVVAFADLGDGISIPQFVRSPS